MKCEHLASPGHWLDRAQIIRQASLFLGGFFERLCGRALEKATGFDRRGYGKTAEDSALVNQRTPLSSRRLRFPMAMP
jgi:hypothetical protein